MAVPVKKLSPAPNPAERRAHDRASVVATSVIRDQSDSGPIEVETRDVSPSGCLFVAPIQLPVGARIAIGLSGAGSAEATIVRSSGGMHACLFDRVLSDADMQMAFTGTAIVRLTEPAASWEETDRWARHTRYRLVLGLGALAWIAVAALAFA